MSQRKRLSAKAWALGTPAGKASNCIRPIDDLRPGDNVILCCRVSGCTQKRRNNLSDQEANLRQAVEQRGAVVVDVVKYVGSGWDPSWLRKPARQATEAGEKLVAESTNRFIRHLDYHSDNNPDAQASESDLEELRLWTLDVPLVTALDPDATPGQERAYEIDRGRRQKGKKGGRPRNKKPGEKKRRREKQLPRALRFHARGLSLGEIAALTKTPRSTVQKWIKKYA
ncbi:MAG: helix-turn-helix domain-containing protein [Candidatus Anammoximicrobium sp.]|nr:helix-turn-helix domain-containing protein [Candidatus Anammoximicrobium sp.]